MKPQIQIDGLMVASVIGLVAVVYVLYKKDDVIAEVKKGTNITSADNWINRATVHLLGVSDQGYGDLGSWFYCLTHSTSAVCLAKNQAAR